MDENQIIDELKVQGIDLVSAIPCDKAKGLFFRLPEAFRHIGLTREEDGVGISAGAYLAGARPLIALQSSGLGNMLNAILSLTVTFGLPLPILASWRGGTNETIPAQIPFNRPLPRILAAAGIPCTILSNRNSTKEIGDAVAHTFRKNTPHVILIRPGCIDEGGCLPAADVPAYPAAGRLPGTSYTREWRDPVMTRYDAIAAIAGQVSGEILVSNIGVPSKELYAAKDRRQNFYMLGSYTQASSIGLGIATVRPEKRVIVLDGDGSLLGSSILPVIAAAAPGNLTVVGLDNGVFGSTGNQPRPGIETADLRLLAMGSGFRKTWTVHEPGELAEALAGSAQGGPAFIHARIRPGNRDVPNIPLEPVQIRDRFRAALATGL
ncbi:MULTISPECIES: sulfopyruvate decarboxylase subunit beta [unclassified Methanoregula]|uniref:sulfopyruvate decarboxylase subunit beta n=1 Tax=unclassified Methanoregula TaxID=2649730 RepID=UPI0009C47787|nr:MULTISPECIES: sulfopyruvate decarboxylase subunit beta [unclassified Methanoregula]OPX62645.1 MAG: Sulfopyruvate decarboxylase [Methanoregula sp. PtaB.Bin085]OPY33020.1 MAG: Sulfopyruvate decarboxylase [Methanoregula sp. PtaU1.Bin006]